MATVLTGVGKFLATPAGQALAIQAIDFAFQRLTSNPDEDPEFLAALEGYNKAVEEDRELTEAEIDAIIARRKKLFGE
jgi:hypothetical protein